MNRRQFLKITGLSDAKLKYLARNDLTPVVKGESAEREGYNGYGVNEALMTRLSVEMARNSIEQRDATTTVADGYSALLQRFHREIVAAGAPIYFGICKVEHAGAELPFPMFGPLDDLIVYQDRSGEHIRAASIGTSIIMTSLVNFSRLVRDAHAIADAEGVAPFREWVAALEAAGAEGM